jgi:uncharacterized membrane protein YozB (DUF420 family)
VSGKELLAALNAGLNGTSALLLILAYLTIRRGVENYCAHAWFMLAALTTSAVFLVFYVTSYVVYGDRSSGLPPGLFRTSYLLMLASHVLLAMVMLPMIGVTLWRAYRRDWLRHRRIARPTYWIWLYVSITGVLIYLVLYHIVPAMYPATPTAGA